MAEFYIIEVINIKHYYKYRISIGLYNTFPYPYQKHYMFYCI